MSAWEKDIGAWVRSHAAYFDVDTLYEELRGRRVPVGFLINVYARLPRGGPATARWVEAAEVRAELRRMLRVLGPADGSLEFQPPRTTVFRATDAHMQLEVVVSARVFYGEDGVTSVTRSRQRAYAGVMRLREIGLAERNRPLVMGRSTKGELHE